MTTTTTATTSQVIRVGIVGFGFSVRAFQLPFLLARPHLYSVRAFLLRSDRSAAAAQKELADSPLLLQHSDPSAITLHTSLDAFLADDNIDLVVLAVPAYTHRDLALAALAARKHVLVEKPFAVSSADAEAILRKAKEVDRTVCVYQNRRFDGDFLLLRNLLGITDPQGRPPAPHFPHAAAAEPTLTDADAAAAAADPPAGILSGAVELASHFDRLRPGLRDPTAAHPAWKEDGRLLGTSILYDLGSHLIDQALCLFGVPDSLYAVHLADQRRVAPAAHKLNITYPDGHPFVPTPDYFLIVLRYFTDSETRAPLVVRLSAGMLVRPAAAAPRFTVHAPHASATFAGLDPQEAALKQVPVGHPAPADLVPRAPPAPSDGAAGQRDDDDPRFCTVATGTEPRAAARRVFCPPGDYGVLFDALAAAVVRGGEAPVSPLEAWWVVRIIEAAIESAERDQVVRVKGVIVPPADLE
ncbi:hypothetical protein DFJ73DRAFT_471464 [Zopfochytrium polystomum]|nr:hypothetical protein DFJ73DRAFT_471464 [Zopfochytrium polystomum]